MTPDDYKKLTGTSLEESMTRIKAHMSETKARVAKAEQAKRKQTIIPMDMRYAMPMAASAQDDAGEKEES